MIKRLVVVGLLTLLLSVPTPSSAGGLSVIFRQEARVALRAESHAAARVAIRTEIRASEEAAHLAARSSVRPATHMSPRPLTPAFRAAARGAAAETGFSVRTSPARPPVSRTVTRTEVRAAQAPPAPKAARPAERAPAPQATAPLNFNKDIRGKMRRRDWTKEQVYEAIEKGKAVHRSDGSVRYLHRETGKSVSIDPKTGKIYQVGKEGYSFTHREGPAPRTPPKKKG